MGRVLEYQLEDLLNASISGHGFWLVNHREIIEEDLKSGIVRFGVRRMLEKLDDEEFYRPIYAKIEKLRGKV